jgi:hypothetical protein
MDSPCDPSAVQAVLKGYRPSEPLAWLQEGSGISRAWIADDVVCARPAAQPASRPLAVAASRRLVHGELPWAPLGSGKLSLKYSS